MTREQLDAIRDRVDEATARGWSMEAKVLADARGLLAEVERLNAERDAAFRRGVAAMREAAAVWVADFCSFSKADRIRALPSPEDTP